MKDAEYLFRQTEIERKRIARGDHNKKRQGGKMVRFPSDYLTKKEREAMNSEVKVYDAGMPIKWETFKKWPTDLQKIYLLGLRDKYNAFTKDVSDMLGIDAWTLSQLQKKIGIGLSRGGQRPKLKENEWRDFLNKGCVRLELAEEPPKEAPSTVEPAPEKVDEPAETPSEKVVEIDHESSRILNIAMLLESLKGSGAKLTIEVTL